MHSILTPERWAQIYAEADGPALHKLATDKALPTVLQRQLCTARPDLASFVLEHTPDQDLIRHFLDSEFDDVREAIAINPNTPPGALAMLAADPSEYVRAHVAKTAGVEDAPVTVRVTMD
jgi:hypothetical protein